MADWSWRKHYPPYGTTKHDPRHTLTTPLRPFDRQVAALLALRTPSKDAVAALLGVHRSAVWKSWYRPAVQAYIEKLLTADSQELIQQHVAQLLASDQAERIARKHKREARRQAHRAAHRERPRA